MNGEMPQPTTTSAAGRKATDGRHQRSARSQTAIVEACLALVRSGVSRPSSSQIADEAGVTQRTLFNQFGDMDSLLSAVANRQVEHFVSLLPRPHGGTRAERTTRFVADLVHLLEDTRRVRWTVLTTSISNDIGIDAVRHARQLIRASTVAAFADEFDGVDPVRREALLDAFDPALDAAMWHVRRDVYGMTISEATAAVTLQVQELLDRALIDGTDVITLDGSLASSD